MKRSLSVIFLGVFVLTAGCNRVYVRHRPAAVVVSHTPVYTEPVYYDDYYDGYAAQGALVVGYYPEIYIGTTIFIGGVECYWCDFCQMWHPRCMYDFCFCAPAVIRHYGFYRTGHYYNHCFHWRYDPVYKPVISTYRFRHDGRYYSYNIREKKRSFLTSRGLATTTERVRYRGKDVERYTYTPPKELDGITKKRAKNSDRNREVSRSRDTGAQKTKKSGTASSGKRTVEKKHIDPAGRSGAGSGSRTKETGSITRTAEKSREQTRSAVSKSGNRATEKKRVESNKKTVTKKKSGGGRSILSQVGKLLSRRSKSSSSGTSARKTVKSSSASSAKTKKQSSAAKRTITRKKKKGGGW